MALFSFKSRPIPIANLDRSLRKNAEAKEQHIATQREVLFKEAAEAKAARYLTRLDMDLDLCTTTGNAYIGRSVWKIRRLQYGWRRTARLRARLETRPSSRRLVESKKAKGKPAPDERDADLEHVKRYRTKGQGWRGPKPRPEIFKRKCHNPKRWNWKRARRKYIRYATMYDLTGRMAHRNRKSYASPRDWLLRTHLRLT